MNGENMMADGELAWTSLDKHSKRFEMHHFSSGYDNKIHPCQKPIRLYEWLLINYAECQTCLGSGEIPSLTIDCDTQPCKKCNSEKIKILDTHVGSGSSIIAFEKHGFEYCGFEIDKDYYEASTKRILKHRELLKQEQIF